MEKIINAAQDVIAQANAADKIGVEFGLPGMMFIPDIMPSVREVDAAREGEVVEEEYSMNEILSKELWNIVEGIDDLEQAAKDYRKAVAALRMKATILLKNLHAADALLKIRNGEGQEGV